jgi:hypothetical protein
MSELKVIDLGNIRESIEKDEPVYYEYYAKSEADKVIANRDCEIKKLKGALDQLLKVKTEQIIHEVIQKTLIYGEGFIRVQDAMKLIAEIRHNKYKRCLAMVKYCDMGLTYYNEKLDSFSCERADFFYKWYNRWWKLAEKFKEGV